MRILLALVLSITIVNAATLDGGYQRTPLTTNLATFTAPVAGQVPTIHSVSGGIITYTNSVPTVASAVVNISPTAIPALSLTNIISLTGASNNTTYNLLPGTNYIIASQGIDAFGDTTTPIQLVAKTNITIRGEGWNSVIFSATLGDFVRLEHCYNVTFKDFAIIGTRGTYSSATALFGAFNTRGTNAGIVWDNVLFLDHQDFAINAQPEATKFGTNWTIKNCWFENIGGTNTPTGGTPDGAAFQIAGPYNVITDNTFVRCRWAIELEGAMKVAAKGLVISRNRFLAGMMDAIHGVNDSSAGTFPDALISDNYIEFDRSFGWGGQMKGMEVGNISKAIISRNTIRNADMGISLVANAEVPTGWLVIDNEIYDTANYGINFGGNSSFHSCDGCTFSRNYITNTVNDGMFFFDLQRSIISGNVFDRIGTAGLAAAPMNLQTSSRGLINNIIELNTVRTVDASCPMIYVYTSTTNNIIRNNNWLGINANGWNDSGIGNQWYNNRLGASNSQPHIVRSNLVQTTFGGGTQGGTNIIWNVASDPVQFVDVTNTILLIVTNYSVINTAQRSKIVLINNKPTNMGVYISMLGQRLMGADAALPGLASTHNSLTNGKCLVIDSEYIGTNQILTLTHQR